MGSWLLSNGKRFEMQGQYRVLESMPARDQTIESPNEELETVDQLHAIVCGFGTCMEPGIEGQNVFAGFEKSRRALVEISYRDLQLLLGQRVSNF